MFEFIGDIWDSIIHFFNFISWFIDTWPQRLEIGVQTVLKYLTYFIFWMSEQALVVAFDLTQEFLDSFNYQENVQSAWNAVPATPRAILTYFRLPECINILVSAVGTKFALKFVPFGS